MMRAILAGGGVRAAGRSFAGFLYFLSLGGPTSSGQLTIDQATMVGMAALLGGIASLFLPVDGRPLHLGSQRLLDGFWLSSRPPC